MVKQKLALKRYNMTSMLEDNTEIFVNFRKTKDEESLRAHDQRTPESVNKRNQRERTRTERLGSAFKTLQVNPLHNSIKNPEVFLFSRIFLRSVRFTKRYLFHSTMQKYSNQEKSNTQYCTLGLNLHAYLVILYRMKGKSGNKAHPRFMKVEIK